MGEGADPGHIGAGEFGHEAKPRARLSESAVGVAGIGPRSFTGAALTP